MKFPSYPVRKYGHNSPSDTSYKVRKSIDTLKLLVRQINTRFTSFANCESIGDTSAETRVKRHRRIERPSKRGGGSSDVHGPHVILPRNVFLHVGLELFGALYEPLQQRLQPALLGSGRGARRGGGRRPSRRCRRPAWPSPSP